MRILQIGQFPMSPDLIRGGVESSVYGLATEQAKSHAVFALDIPRLNGADSIERIGEVTVYRFRNVGRYQKDASGRIPDMLKIITSLQPSICHLHGTSPFNWIVFDSLRKIGIPVVVTVHGLINVEKKKLLRKHFSLKTLYQLIVQSSAERRILKSAKEVIVDTEYVEKAIRAYHLSTIPHMTIIPQGIQDHFYHISCSDNSHEILSVGAISKRKGHLYLIQSFEKICEKIPDAHLTICGSMAESDYFMIIKEYLSASPYRNRISILTDVPKEELFNLYHKAHLFALHSQEESQGIALAEAMAAGLPVVATKVGGIPYVISDGVTGLLADYGDTISFSSFIEHLMSSHTDWVEMSRMCRKEALLYSWETISEAVSIVYDSML